jgi:hypothetical protein
MAHWLLLGLFALLILFTNVSFAQDADDPDGGEELRYATGLILQTPEELAKYRKTPGVRSYLPPVADLTRYFPRPGDQGGQGSCVAWAVGYAARAYYNAMDSSGARLSRAQIPSPAYIYNSIRFESAPECNKGSFINDGLNLLKKGALSLAAYPYDERVCARPTPTQTANASEFRINDWLLVDGGSNPDKVKREIAAGHPVVIAVALTDSFFRLRKTKAIWRPTEQEETSGYHAVTIVGYREDGQYFKFINSWGPKWSDGGFGRMSYDAYRQRVKEAYVMRLDSTPEPPKPEPTPVPYDPKIVLPTPSCGKLEVVRKDGGLHVHGYVGEEADIVALEAALTGHSASHSVELRKWPQCEVLQTMDIPLSQPDRPVISLPRQKYRDGDILSFDVEMADFSGYLHVAYVQADGTVVNLVRADPLTLTTLDRKARFTFGDGNEGRPKFTVSGPYGTEMIVVLASKSPLFDEKRPSSETEREFLTALRKAILARPNPDSPERFISAGFTTLETAAGQ